MWFFRLIDDRLFLLKARNDGCFTGERLHLVPLYIIYQVLFCRISPYEL